MKLVTIKKAKLEQQIVSKLFSNLFQFEFCSKSKVCQWQTHKSTNLIYPGLIFFNVIFGTHSWQKLNNFANFLIQNLVLNFIKNSMTYNTFAAFILNLVTVWQGHVLVKKWPTTVSLSGDTIKFLCIRQPLSVFHSTYWNGLLLFLSPFIWNFWW